jgi:hypothetical protein
MSMVNQQSGWTRWSQGRRRVSVQPDSAPGEAANYAPGWGRLGPLLPFGEARDHAGQLADNPKRPLSLIREFAPPHYTR